jgi:hypothetical protein
MHENEDLQPDLQPMIDRLRANRPTATALELDAIVQRVQARVANPARRRTRRTSLMKSRMAILSMLVLGMLLSTAGAGLAVSGFSNSNNAAEVQYPDTTKVPDTVKAPAPTPTPTPDTSAVLGDEDQSQGGQDVLPEEDQGGSPPTSRVQPSRQQVESGSATTLPFTGFAAIPILIGGIALLTVGLVLRRRTGDER